MLEKVGKCSELNTTSTDTNSSIQDLNKGLDVRQKTMKSAENQLTIMLLLVTMLFLILLFPTHIRFIYLNLVERDTPSRCTSSMLFFHITYKLYTTNHGINFLLYCVSGKKFLHDLKEMCNIAKSCHSSDVSGKSHSTGINLHSVYGQTVRNDWK